ncbi:hypothetical protein B0H16DRAFT_1380762 [Mycena metata]|uniref:Uncharacterized protein n=1 Tax=Mycena metata TaxID=1033252 RepID=A0AAD7I4X3_9AGAR|nr:hypothetical protein B0H16DRAFT_1380762 [Mycena metata]
MPKSSSPAKPSQYPPSTPKKKTGDSPSTPKKRTYPVSRSLPLTAANTGPLATPNGPSIKRTEATKRYKIKPTDLDTILPISRQPNFMGGAWIQTYNEGDVATLALNRRPGKPLPQLGPEADPSSPLAEKKGPRIMRTTAIKEFKLTASQLDELKPISATPNSYGTVTKFYNRSDVQDLKSRLDQQQLGVNSPSPPPNRNHFMLDRWEDPEPWKF